MRLFFKLSISTRCRQQRISSLLDSSGRKARTFFYVQPLLPSFITGI